MLSCAWFNRSGSLAALDRKLLLAARTLPHSSEGDQIAAGLSATADHARGWAVLGVLGAACGQDQRARWLQAAGAVILAEQASRYLKRLGCRARPQLDGLPPLASVTSPYSLPSSHTATAVTAIYAFDGLLPSRMLIVWALLTAASRPYLGVHYPSDVFAGAALGLLTGWVSRALTAA